MPPPSPDDPTLLQAQRAAAPRPERIGPYRILDAWSLAEVFADDR